MAQDGVVCQGRTRHAGSDTPHRPRAGSRAGAASFCSPQPTGRYPPGLSRLRQAALHARIHARVHCTFIPPRTSCAPGAGGRDCHSHPRLSGLFPSQHTDARKGASLSCMVLRTMRFSAWHLPARLCQWKWGQETCLQELTKRCFPSNPARAAWRELSSIFKALRTLSVYG